MDMINNIEGVEFIWDRYVLCTMDIELLYTNIPQDIALEKRAVPQSAYGFSLCNWLLSCIRRSCTNREDLGMQVYYMKSWYRGDTPRNWWKNALKRARYTPRETLLIPKQRKEEVPMTCVITYSLKANKLKKIINKPLSILSGLNVPKPVFAFKKSKNIKQHLVKANRSVEKDRGILTLMGLPPIVGHYKCHKCLVCKLTQDTKSIKINDVEVCQTRFSNCNTKNVVYSIQSPCNKTYIGQTMQPVKTRILQHKGHHL